MAHATEDKDVARQLSSELRQRGYGIWFDEFVLEMGDSLRQEIDRGLSKCRFGIVVLSPHFFAKRWPQQELNGLAARESTSGRNLILPVWHELDAAGVAAYSPMLADRLGVPTSIGISGIADRIERAMEKAEGAVQQRERLVYSFGDGPQALPTNREGQRGTDEQAITRVRSSSAMAETVGAFAKELDWIAEWRGDRWWVAGLFETREGLRFLSDATVKDDMVSAGSTYHMRPAADWVEARARQWGLKTMYPHLSAPQAIALARNNPSVSRALSRGAVEDQMADVVADTSRQVEWRFAFNLRRTGGKHVVLVVSGAVEGKYASGYGFGATPSVHEEIPLHLADWARDVAQSNRWTDVTNLDFERGARAGRGQEEGPDQSDREHQYEVEIAPERSEADDPRRFGLPPEARTVEANGGSPEFPLLDQFGRFYAGNGRYAPNRPEMSLRAPTFLPAPNWWGGMADEQLWRIVDEGSSGVSEARLELGRRRQLTASGRRLRT